MRNQDPAGHYAALSVSPGCSQQEIQLAYRLLKQAYREGRQSLEIGKIRAAYQVLGDRKTRASYDKGKWTWNLAGEDHRVRFDSLPLLVGLLIVLGGVLYFLFGSTWHEQRIHFAVGDQLIWKATEEPAGEVTAFEQNHVFSPEVSGPAYRIVAEGEEPVWYPARDLKRHAKPAG